jgi:hypothetical protein
MMTMPDPDFNFTKSRSFLTSNNRERILKEWANTKEKQTWIEQGYVGGLARGGSGYHTRVKMHGRRYGRYGGNYCPFFQYIEIEVYYGTVIFIANEFKKGTCRFESVMEHEMRHHKTNHDIAEKYAKMLERDLPKMVAEVEGLGYVHYTKADARFDFMRQSLIDAIQVYSEAMGEEMNRENAKIDTLENYQAESKLCPGERD